MKLTLNLLKLHPIQFIQVKQINSTRFYHMCACIGLYEVQSKKRHQQPLLHCHNFLSFLVIALFSVIPFCRKWKPENAQMCGKTVPHIDSLVVFMVKCLSCHQTLFIVQLSFPLTPPSPLKKTCSMISSHTHYIQGTKTARIIFYSLN